MTDDVIIPREDARKWADALRAAFDQLGGSAPLVLIGLVDLLDPPAPSLRDEVANAIAVNLPKDGTGLYAADVALAVVRKRIEALRPDRDFDGYTPDEAWEAGRDDAARLLGGESGE